MSETSHTANFRAALPRGRVGVSGVRLKEAALALAVIAGIAGAADYGHYYWATGRYLVTTDDAYVDAHSVLISPKVAGYIAAVPVDDNQPVKAGEVIATIDPRDYQTALDQARANVAAAQASIDTLTQQIAQQHLAVEQARQSVTVGPGGAVLSAAGFPALRPAGPNRLRRRAAGAAIAGRHPQKQAKLARDTTRGRRRGEADRDVSGAASPRRERRWRSSRRASGRPS